MPRGKYDRKEAKISRLEQELAEAHDKNQAQKDEIDKLHIELKAVKKLADLASKTVSHVEILPSEKFVILRDNLRTLSEARQVLMKTDSMSFEVLSQFDTEITAHLRLLGSLREDSFRSNGKSEAPTQVTVPLPSMPAPFFAQPSMGSVKSAG